MIFRPTSRTVKIDVNKLHTRKTEAVENVIKKIKFTFITQT